MAKGLEENPGARRDKKVDDMGNLNGSTSGK
jgi:hypothetical protein